MIVERLLRVALLGSSWVLYLLLGLSVLSFFAMIDRWLHFRRRRGDVDTLRERVSVQLLEGDLAGALAELERSASVEAGVVRAALRWRSGGARAVSEAVDGELARARRELERGTGVLGTLGNNAPFVGLFGTVIGVIEAFNHLGSNGARAGAMGNVMSGIAEALVATAVGIFVALPAVVAYNAAQKQIADAESNTVSLAKLFTAFLETYGRGGEARPATTRTRALELAGARDDASEAGDGPAISLVADAE